MTSIGNFQCFFVLFFSWERTQNFKHSPSCVGNFVLFYVFPPQFGAFLSEEIVDSSFAPYNVNTETSSMAEATLRRMLGHLIFVVLLLENTRTPKVNVAHSPSRSLFLIIQSLYSHCALRFTSTCIINTSFVFPKCRVTFYEQNIRRLSPSRRMPDTSYLIALKASLCNSLTDSWPIPSSF